MEIGQGPRGELAQVAYRAQQFGAVGEFGLDELQLGRQVRFRLALVPLLQFVLWIQQQPADRVTDQNHFVSNGRPGRSQLLAPPVSGRAGAGRPERQANTRQQQHDQQPERGVQPLPNSHGSHGQGGVRVQRKQSGADRGYPGT